MKRFVRSETIDQMLALGILLAGGSARSCLGAAPEATPTEILNAWRAHAEAITSFRYECDIVERRRYLPGERHDPFDMKERQELEKGGGEEQGLRTKLIFTFDGPRRAVSQRGDQLDYDATNKSGKKYVEFLAAFDGEVFRYLLIDAKFPTMGSLVRVGPMRSEIVGDFGTTPLWVWYDPEKLLKKMGHDLNSLHVVPHAEPEWGDELQEFSLVRPQHPKSPNRWEAGLLVERKPPYLPRQLAYRLNGKTMMLVDLAYQNDAEGRPAISWWEETRYTETGKLEEAKTGKAIRFECNGDFGDAESFVLKFPAGAQVTEEGIQYVQQADGSLKRISTDKSPKGPLK